MNGLRTRQQLAASKYIELHGDGSHIPHGAHKGIPGVAHNIPNPLGPLTEDEDYAFRNGRARDKLVWEEFTLPDRPFMPNMASLGTPGEAERIKAARRLENLYRRWFGVVFSAVIVAAIFMATIGVRPTAPEPITTLPWIDSTQVDTRICKNEWHEGCLVCTHLDAKGQRVRSTHC